MRAKFIGNGDADPDAVTLGGVVFPYGESVDVPPELEAKVRGNGHFAVIKGRPKKARANDENGE